jgi:hypothetical protein
LIKQNSVPSGKQLRTFFASLFLAAAVLAGLGYFSGKPLLLFGMGALAIVLVLIQPFPAARLGFYRLWMAAGKKTGDVTSRLILSIIFFVIFTPVGLLLRLFGRRPLDVRFRDGRSSYWKKRQTPRSDLEKMY